MQAGVLALGLPWGVGGDGCTGLTSPRDGGLLPLTIPGTTLVIADQAAPAAPAALPGSSNRAAGASREDGSTSTHKRYERPPSEDAIQKEAMSVELQMKQRALESTLSDSMVQAVHLQDQLALANRKVQAANDTIEAHVARESMILSSVDRLEEIVSEVQHHFDERLDIEELVGYRTYAQAREKEVMARLHELEDLNARQSVVIKDQASEIAWLRNELGLRTADLEVAIEDLKESANREWKKHRSLCMEIGGVYIDFNHSEGMGLTMNKSAKYGPDEMGFTGVGLKLGNVFPFQVLGVHPDSRTKDGLPAVFHEGDKVVAIDNVNLESLTKGDIDGLIIGPVGSYVKVEIARGRGDLESPKSWFTMELKRQKLNDSIELRAPKPSNRKVTSYARFQKRREFEFHLPPSSTELVGDGQVWEQLLVEGRPVEGHPKAFMFGDKMLHQPVFLEGQDDGHGKQVCCVWDVNNGDIYFRGPPGPPLDPNKIAQRKEAEKLAEDAARLASEQSRIKLAEIEARMKAEVEMRAKLEAEAKLKLEHEGEMKEEMLAKARAEIEARLLASGDLPVLRSYPKRDIKEGPFKTFMESFPTTTSKKSPRQAHNADNPTVGTGSETTGITQQQEASASTGKGWGLVSSIQKVSGFLSKSPRSPKSVAPVDQPVEVLADEPTAGQTGVIESSDDLVAATTLREDCKSEVDVVANEVMVHQPSQDTELEDKISRLAAEEASRRATEQTEESVQVEDTLTGAVVDVSVEDLAVDDDDQLKVSNAGSERTNSKSPGRSKTKKKRK